MNFKLKTMKIVSSSSTPSNQIQSIKMSHRGDEINALRFIAIRKDFPIHNECNKKPYS